MGEIKYNARAFSRLGQCGTIFGIAATELHDLYDIVCLSADMSTPAGLDRYKRSYPNDFYNVGIAEQNMIGIAAGLASEHHSAVCVTQAAFISMRAYEQVRQMMGYMQYPVITVGLSSGFALTYLGNTHYAIEDIAIMRSIPGMCILSPADAGAALVSFETALQSKCPTYIRLSGPMPTPIVYKEEPKHDLTKISAVATYGSDAAIFATGSMVYHSIKAAEGLHAQGIDCTVYDVCCIKPLDADAIAETLGVKVILTVEEHNIIGGLGTAVAEVLSQYTHHPKLVRLGVQDTFSPVGDYPYLLHQHGLTAESIANTVKNNL